MFLFFQNGTKIFLCLLLLALRAMPPCYVAVVLKRVLSNVVMRKRRVAVLAKKLKVLLVVA